MPILHPVITPGLKINRWTVTSDRFCIKDEKGKYRTYHECICECGVSGRVREDSLKRGGSLSCGCLQHEMLSKIAYRHGEHTTPLYHVWASMKARCLTTTHHAWPDYGKRGITVCEEWMSFVPFRDWAIKNGYKKGLILDRKDNNGNYEPDNCRWVTWVESNRNTRGNLWIEYNGVRKVLKEWADELQLSASTISRRLKRGWTAKQALFTPYRQRLPIPA